MEIATGIAQEIFRLGSMVVANGLVVSMLTEILKIDVIKIPASKYPKTTAGVLSLVLSAIAVFSLNILVFDNWISWLIFAGATLLVALKSYDWVLKGLYEKLT